MRTKLQLIKRAFSMFAVVGIAFGVLTGLCQPASASYVLNNTNGGDGFVTLAGSGFDLFGADNGVGQATTTYTNTATQNATLNFNYTYTTNDCCGSFWDPAGYVLNGIFTQLTPNSSIPGYKQSGIITLNVAPGDTFGFYVSSVDSVAGRGDIAIGTAPIPASLPMFAAGLLALFGLAQYSSRKNAFNKAV